MTVWRYDHWAAHSEKCEESRLNAGRSSNHIDSAAFQEHYAVFVCSQKSHHMNSLWSADRDESCLLLQNEQISKCRCFMMSDEWFEMMQWSELHFVIVNESETLVKVRTDSLEWRMSF